MTDVEDLHRRARLAHAAYVGGLRGPAPFDALSEDVQALWRGFVVGAGRPGAGDETGRIDRARAAHHRIGRPSKPYRDLSPQRQLRWRRALKALDDDLTA